MGKHLTWMAHKAPKSVQNVKAGFTKFFNMHRSAGLTFGIGATISREHRQTSQSPDWLVPALWLELVSTFHRKLQ